VTASPPPRTSVIEEMEAASVAPPAVVNAVRDALAPLDADVPEMPLTDERVWHAIHGI
jgi:CO/xanthine dehydrogenase Mo-binding subunit